MKVTKAACKAAVEALGGRFIHDDDFGYWDTQAEAPVGHHWGDCHCRVLLVWNKQPGSKDAYWEDVMDEISRLGTPIKCVDDPWCIQWDHCEYWEDEAHE